MNKIWSVVCILVGTLLACASIGSLWVVALNPDGNGMPWGVMAIIFFFLDSMSVLSFVAAWKLWRSDED
jgi:hypothetical protein